MDTTQGRLLGLSLDYTKPLEWYKKNNAKVFWLLFAGCAVLALWALGETTTNWDVITIVLIAILLIAIRGAVRSRFLEEKSSEASWRDRLGLLEQKFSKNLTTWLLSSETLAQQLWRPFLLILLALPPSVTLFLFLERDYGHLATLLKTTPLLVKVILLTCLALTVPLIVFLANILIAIVFHGFISIFVLVFTLILLILEILLKFCRGLVYRIAEYSKGAFAAIIILVTLALAVTEFYLKYQPPVSPQTIPARTSPSPSP
jgi:hypothetical protein